MSRLNDRMKKLESNNQLSEPGPRCIIVRGMVADAQPEQEICKLTEHDMSFERLPSESDHTFIEGARTSVMNTTPSVGIALFVAD